MAACNNLIEIGAIMRCYFFSNISFFRATVVLVGLDDEKFDDLYDRQEEPHEYPHKPYISRN